MAYGDISTDIIFDQLDIRSEEYARGLIGGDWYWVDHEGNPTKDISRRHFGGWYDQEK